MVEILPQLPLKIGIPNKTLGDHVKKAIYVLPIILSVLMSVALVIGFLVARWLGYDNIWHRFKLMYHRLRLWKTFAQYEQVHDSPPAEDIDDDVFEFEEEPLDSSNHWRSSF